MRFFVVREKGMERSVLLDWLQHHRLMVTVVFCLLITLIIALIITVVLFSGHKTYINAWYV